MCLASLSYATDQLAAEKRENKVVPRKSHGLIARLASRNLDAQAGKDHP
jgi:hypothetical protein